MFRIDLDVTGEEVIREPLERRIELENAAGIDDRFLDDALA